MSEYTLVEQPDSICSDLALHDRVGVDTEFMRERTFFAELSLVQVSTGAAVYCVDPLAGNSVRSFWETLTKRTWVVHSARQDIEVIYQSAQLMPSALFDTQVAGGLLGLAPQLGYAGLVKELFDVEETIGNRLDVYRENTEPVVEFYRKRDRLITVDAEGTIDEVYERLLQALS